MNIHLGCGKRYIPGFIHVDLADFPHIDYKHEINSLPMFPDNSADLIYSCHSFEYFDREEAPKVLKEWFRVLKPGGILRLAVPDFEALIEVYKKTGEISKALGPLFGRWIISGKENESPIYHRTTYDFSSLKKVLEESGFSNIYRYDWRNTIHKDYDDYSQAYYPHMDKEKGTLISLNVEAVKPSSENSFNVASSEKNKKVALITGVTGQDGSYLSEILLEKGYEVHGIMRRSSSFNTGRIEHLYGSKDFVNPSNKNFFTHYGDLNDPISIANIIDEVKPDEIYNLGAMSQVRVSFDTPEYTLNTNTLGALNILEYIRKHCPKTKYYQASSSEMFGATKDIPPYNENTRFLPQSPYGISKLASFHLTKIYRSGYNLFASNGILFNHESPRRGETFVTRKITLGIGAILRGETDELHLGNLDAVRDWGHSKDYMKAVHLIMQQEKPDDYVVSTGEAHSIKEALEFCFSEVNLDWKKYVVIDQKYFRPNEVPYLEGDSSKIRELGWKPEYTWKDTLREMLEQDAKPWLKK